MKSPWRVGIPSQAFPVESNNMIDVCAANPSGRASADAPDHDLLQIYAQFCAAHAALDRLLASDEDPPDEEGLARHREWQDALNRALPLPAVTPAGKRAKAAMLLAAVNVILGTDEQDVLPRELIAC